MASIRLDEALLKQGLCHSIQEATALIASGKVLVNQQRIDKAGTKIKTDAIITLKAEKVSGGWVSRGALKLRHAITSFNISPHNQHIIDVGACTGGFTEVLLHHGAAHIYAVDVGYGELAWKLRNDPRVTVLERQNARQLTANHIPQPVDAVVCDASFIGLATVLPTPLSFVKYGGWLVALIKPQFELQAADIPAGGVVTDAALHQRACDDVVAWLNSQPEWSVQNLTESPILGAEGNKEFLLYACKTL